MALILGIDPGSKESGYAYIEADGKCTTFGKVSNEDILYAGIEAAGVKHVYIERIVLYKKAGTDVRDTCEWVGRFVEHATARLLPVTLITRANVRGKLDANNDKEVIAAMKERGYTGLSKDAWQALAVAIVGQMKR